jgi:hypothetical protein
MIFERGVAVRQGHKRLPNGRVYLLIDKDVLCRDRTVLWHKGGDPPAIPQDVRYQSF